MNDYNMIMAIAGAIGTLGTAGFTIRHLFVILRKRRELHKASILNEAKKEVDAVQQILENRVKSMEVELALHKESMAKDLVHLKETYTAEMANLGQKIENLRNDIQQQHQALIGLLTRLISSK